jgi:two-component system NtrC family sensor kinase
VLRPIPYRVKLLLGFALVIGVAALISTLAGFSFISRTLVKEAMLRVEMDLGAAWSAFEDEKLHLQTVVSLASQRESFRAVLAGAGRDPRAVAAELEGLRKRNGLDFLTLIDARGAAVARSRPPWATGDSLADTVVVQRALAGNAGLGTALMSPEELRREGDELAERAYIPLMYTERAEPTERAFEARGLVMQAAIPIFDAGERVQGVLYGGVLLNRKFDLVDRIRDAVFGDRTYAGRPVGTVTFFLGDVRIATNVMLDAGTRALGTRVSDQVGERVLQRGQRFADRAFVVNDWYLSAYDPIRDPEGRIVGIIYVGLLEKIYLGYKLSLAVQFLGISVGALLFAALIAIMLASRLRQPVDRLVRATRELESGNLDARVELPGASREMVELGHAFNVMAETLGSRTRELEQATAEAHRAYLASEERNRAYLEMLGFVTHELKSPLASVVFAIGSLRDHVLGPLNEQQEALLRAAASSADYLHDTIANYLNLARIEEGGLVLRLTDVSYARDIVAPVVARLADFAADKRMRIASAVDDGLCGECDPALITSVFQNLLSNAVKYGRDGGTIRVSGERTDGELRFSVWNEGRGFTRDAGEKLFGKFTRVGLGGVDTRTGTGLGLFVSRTIIERHGGRIWAQSEPELWAEFLFTLPVRAAVGDLRPQAAPGS